ncbi:MAG: ABC transporter permease, partial [Comamonadaceae bacterium]
MPPPTTTAATTAPPRAAPRHSVPARPGVISSALRRYLPSVLIFVAVFLVWQLVVSVFGVRQYILPSPASVWGALVGSDVPWGKHMLITTIEILGGFVLAAIVGVLLGTAIAWSDTASRALMPFLVFVNTLPKVAIAPLILLWFGYGIGPNMLIGAIIGFFS